MKKFDWNKNSLRHEVQETSGEFLKALNPFANPYSSELNPLFLFQVEKLSELSKFEVVLARDGLVPLLWFFYRFQTPGKLRTTILIPKELQEFVPVTWKKNVKLYEMVSLKPIKKPKKILIFGLGIETNISSADLVRLKIPDVEFECYLPVKTDRFTPTSSDKYPLELILAVNSLSKKPIKALSSIEITEKNSFEDTAFIELNRNKLISDSYIKQIILSKGGTPFQKQKPEGPVIPLSLHHGVVLSKPSGMKSTAKLFDPDEIEYFMDFERRVMFDIASRTGLWPQWFQAFALSKLSD